MQVKNIIYRNNCKIFKDKSGKILSVAILRQFHLYKARLLSTLLSKKTFSPYSFVKVHPQCLLYDKSPDNVITVITFAFTSVISGRAVGSRNRCHHTIKTKKHTSHKCLRQSKSSFVVPKSCAGQLPYM